MDIVTSLCLLGYCWGLKRYSHLRLETIPFFLVTGLITLLYVGAYIHLLAPISYAILIFGFLLFLTLPYFWYKNPNDVYQNFLTPSVVSLLFYVIIFGLMVHQLKLSVWDEFTHWGPHAKLVYFHQGFYLKSDVTVNKSYPVGSALFYFPFYLLEGKYSEGTSYYAQLILLLSPLFTLQPAFTWDKWKQSFIAFSAIIIAMLALKVRLGFSASLYMDAATGLFIGAILVNFFRSKGEYADIFQMIPMVVALCLLKPKLYPFVLLILFIVMVDLIMRFYQATQLTKSSLALKLLSLLSIPAAVYISHYSWVKYLASINLRPAHSLGHVTTHALFQTFIHPTPFQQEVIHHFLEKSLSYAPLICIFLLLAVISSYLMQDKLLRCRFNIISALLFLGVGVYYFGLLIIYLFTFVPNEALDVASLYRYTHIYHLMLSLFILYYLLSAISANIFVKKTNGLQIFALTMIIGAILCASFFKEIKLKNSDHFHRSIGFLRIAMKKIADKTKIHLKQGDTVDIIWQNSTGIERAIIGYALVPTSANSGPSSIGKPYNKEDVWTQNLTKKMFIKQMRHYQYVLVAYSDEQFINQYGDLFPHHFINLKPLTEYTICVGSGFNPDRKARCHLQTEKAYLFKVLKHGNKVGLMNVN
ncbi:MAG: hypothetical protein NTZ67_00675 [Gammaproteobacteria bacterium]|nr:hypothetical protein [Gammaproteobacteria bacterium]